MIPDTLFLVDWGEIDAILQHATFSGFKKVEVCYLACPADEGVAEPDFIPQCCTRSIACVRKVEGFEVSLIL
jgi:hypothetical protein